MAPTSDLSQEERMLKVVSKKTAILLHVHNRLLVHFYMKFHLLCSVFFPSCCLLSVKLLCGLMASGTSSSHHAQVPSWSTFLNKPHFSNPSPWTLSRTLNAKPRMGRVWVNCYRVTRAGKNGQVAHWWLKGSLGEKKYTKSLKERMRNCEIGWWWKKRRESEQERSSESLSDLQWLSRENETSGLELHNGKRRRRKRAKAPHTWAVC